MVLTFPIGNPYLSAATTHPHTFIITIHLILIHMEDLSLSSSSAAADIADTNNTVGTAVDAQDYIRGRETAVYEQLLEKARKSGQDTTIASLRLGAKMSVEKELFDLAITSGNSLTIHDAPRQYWQALTAETIATRWNLNPWSLFAWAERHNVALLQANTGGRLCMENAWVWRDFYEDKPLCAK